MHASVRNSDKRQKLETKESLVMRCFSKKTRYEAVEHSVTSPPPPRRSTGQQRWATCAPPSLSSPVFIALSASQLHLVSDRQLQALRTKQSVPTPFRRGVGWGKHGESRGKAAEFTPNRSSNHRPSHQHQIENPECPIASISVAAAQQHTLNLPSTPTQQHRSSYTRSPPLRATDKRTQ